MNESASPMIGNVLLRDVIEDDLPILFEHQLDPEATAMADFPSRGREAFMAHWARILRDATLIKQTILYNGQVAGNIVSWEQSGERLVGYWLGKEFWGRGIASKALSLFLSQITTRPLYAHVVKHNIASRRVLEKCGFVLLDENVGAPKSKTQEDEDLILKLA
jgi:RimJ/RimL family protein N-acetyltransferase